MKRKMLMIVRGKNSEWVFTFDGKPEYLKDWQEDGLRVYEVLGSCPAWIADLGFARLWMGAHRAWQWLRVW